MATGFALSFPAIALLCPATLFAMALPFNVTLTAGNLTVGGFGETVIVEPGTKSVLRWESPAGTTVKLGRSQVLSSTGSIPFTTGGHQRWRLTAVLGNEKNAWEVTVKSDKPAQRQQQSEETVRFAFVTDRDGDTSSTCSLERWARTPDDRHPDGFSSGLLTISAHKKVRCSAPSYIGSVEDVIAKQLESTKASRLVVFVHGYNNTFRSAMTAATELFHHMDLKDSVGLLYSWPSNGKPLAYFVDEGRSELSALRFFSLLDGKSRGGC